MIQGSIPGRGKRFFSSPTRPDWLWGPPSLLFNGYRWWGGHGMKLATHLQLLPGLRTCAAVPLLPLYVSMAWKGPSLHIGPNLTWQPYNLKKIYKAAVTW